MGPNDRRSLYPPARSLFANAALRRQIRPAKGRGALQGANAPRNRLELSTANAGQPGVAIVVRPPFASSNVSGVSQCQARSTHGEDLPRAAPYFARSRPGNGGRPI